MKNLLSKLLGRDSRAPAVKPIENPEPDRGRMRRCCRGASRLVRIRVQAEAWRPMELRTMNSISPRRMPISSNSRSESRDNSRTAPRYLRQAVNFSEIVLRAVVVYSFSGRRCVCCSAVCSAAAQHTLGQQAAVAYGSRFESCLGLGARVLWFNSGRTLNSWSCSLGQGKSLLPQFFLRCSSQSRRLLADRTLALGQRRP
jgi:hypothetical protein